MNPDLGNGDPNVQAAPLTPAAKSKPGSFTEQGVCFLQWPSAPDIHNLSFHLGSVGSRMCQTAQGQQVPRVPKPLAARVAGQGASFRTLQLLSPLAEALGLFVSAHKAAHGCTVRQQLIKITLEVNSHSPPFSIP